MGPADEQAELEAKDRQLAACAAEAERLRRSGDRTRAAAADAAVIAAARGSALDDATDGTSAAGGVSVIALRCFLRQKVLEKPAQTCHTSRDHTATWLLQAAKTARGRVNLPSMWFDSSRLPVQLAAQSYAAASLEFLVTVRAGRGCWRWRGG